MSIVQKHSECPICLEGKESTHVKCSRCIYTICKTCFDSLPSKQCPYCRLEYPRAIDLSQLEINLVRDLQALEENLRRQREDIHSYIELSQAIDDPMEQILHPEISSSFSNRMRRWLNDLVLQYQQDVNLLMSRYIEESRRARPSPIQRRQPHRRPLAPLPNRRYNLPR